MRLPSPVLPAEAPACDDTSVATNCTITIGATQSAEEAVKEHGLSGDISSTATLPGGAAAASNTQHPTTPEVEQTRQVLPEAEDEQVVHQSSVERNIWSVFNPLWGSFRVNQPRLPRRSDAGADWARTMGRPEEMRSFLGLKNRVNRA